MTDQISAFKISFVLFFVLGLLIFFVLRKRRVFLSDRACMYVSMAIAIHVYNIIPVITAGGFVSYDDGRRVGSLEFFAFLVLVSLVPYWIAILSERSLKKTLDKKRG